METRHPIEGYFGNEFPSTWSTCNHCEVMAAWSCKTLKKIRFFCVFWKNDPLEENFQNSVPKGFIASAIDELCSNFVKFGRRKIGKIVSCLYLTKTKIRLTLQLSLLRRSHPKSARTSPDNVLRVFQISSKSVLIQRSLSKRVNTARACSVAQCCLYVTRNIAYRYSAYDSSASNPDTSTKLCR